MPPSNFVTKVIVTRTPEAWEAYGVSATGLRLKTITAESLDAICRDYDRLLYEAYTESGVEPAIDYTIYLGDEYVTSTQFRMARTANGYQAVEAGGNAQQITSTSLDALVIAVAGASGGSQSITLQWSRQLPDLRVQSAGDQNPPHPTASSLPIVDPSALPDSTRKIKFYWIGPITVLVLATVIVALFVIAARHSRLSAIFAVQAIYFVFFWVAGFSIVMYLASFAGRLSRLHLTGDMLEFGPSGKLRKSTMDLTKLQTCTYHRAQVALIGTILYEKDGMISSPGKRLIGDQIRFFLAPYAVGWPVYYPKALIIRDEQGQGLFLPTWGWTRQKQLLAVIANSLERSGAEVDFEALELLRQKLRG